MAGERIARFEQDQQIAEPDLNNIGKFARASLDHVVRDAVEPGKKFVGFNVAQNGAAQVTVGEGWYYNAGRVYHRGDQGGTDIDLITLLPVTVQKIVSIVVWGQEVDASLEPRTFLVDVDTEQTEARTTATQTRRVANLDTVSGLESADPVPPALSSDVIAIAHVVLSPAGIEEIRPVTANRLPSIADNRNRIGALELFRNRAGAAIDTLRTDIAGVAAKQRGMVDQDAFFDVTADVSRIKELLELPVDLAAFGSDNFLDDRHSDTDHPDWLARLEEGVRFPPAQQREANLNLLNQFDASVKVANGLMLPAYTESTRISVDGDVSELSISQYQFQTVETVQKTVVSERVRFGSTMRKCTNGAWWKSGNYNSREGIFTRAGRTFQVVSREGHKHYRLREIFIDEVEDHYWEDVVTTEEVSGSTVSQTFLNAQLGWMTSLNLLFTRVAGTGNVHVMITETKNGRPAFDKVIARTTVDVEDLKVAPQKTNIPIGPVLLDQERYAVLIMTSGNHYVGTVTGNKFGQGTLFYSTDGAFAQGDLTRDLIMDLKFAEFTSPRIEVQMEPLELENGIANIDILADAIRPAGTEIAYEVQVNSVWKTLDEVNAGMLVGLPALLPFRIAFTGTTDAHAGIYIGSGTRVVTWRPRTDYRHVSDVIDLPSPSNEIELRIVVEWWNDERHAIDIELLTGASHATVVEPDTTEERALPDLMEVEDRVEFRAVFNLGAAVPDFRIKLSGTTDNALVTYHVAQRTHIAF